MTSTPGSATANTTKSKSSASETGHAKNVSNFQALITFVSGFGQTYNPSKDALKLPNLVVLHSEANAKLNDVIQKITAYNNATNARQEAFSELKSLSTRLTNALQTTNASKNTIDDAKGFNRKMQGRRASTKQTPNNPDAPEPKTISTSQQSYDQLIQHFTGLVSILASEPSYTPNEVELQVATLQAKIADLLAKNNAVNTAYAEISNARIARNQVLYHPENGLVEAANDVKKYVKSVFGTTSPQFAQIKGIAIRTSK